MHTVSVLHLYWRKWISFTDERI